MSRYPIVFGLRDVIQGRGFLAGVAVDGRALLHEEPDGSIWIEGVNPGGFSETGTSFTEALASFRRAYSAILFDIAAEAATFADFREQVEIFFHDGAARVIEDWERAVEDVRAGKVTAEWLTRKPAREARLEIRVEEIRQPSADNNEVEPGPALAA